MRKKIVAVILALASLVGVGFINASPASASQVANVGALPCDNNNGGNPYIVDHCVGWMNGVDPFYSWRVEMNHIVGDGSTNRWAIQVDKYRQYDAAYFGRYLTLTTADWATPYVVDGINHQYSMQVWMLPGYYAGGPYTYQSCGGWAAGGWNSGPSGSTQVTIDPTHLWLWGYTGTTIYSGDQCYGGTGNYVDNLVDLANVNVLDSNGHFMQSARIDFWG